MSKILISILLATAATSPAWAAQDNYSERQAPRQSEREDRQSTRAERQSAREERQSAHEAATADRAKAHEQRSNLVAPTATASQPAEQQPQATQRSTSRQAAREAAAAQRAAARERVAEGQVTRNARTIQHDPTTRLTREDFQRIREARKNARPPIVSTTPKPNTQPPAPSTTPPTPAPTWNTGWRNDGRYNWSNYRRHHRSLYHFGLYYDPFGWGYQPYSIGWRMWPSYYGSSFWLNDPWQYRLPYAPPGTRWIRYYDDAILVDMWSGQVVDVIYDFFW